MIYQPTLFHKPNKKKVSNKKTMDYLIPQKPNTFALGEEKGNEAEVCEPSSV